MPSLRSRTLDGLAGLICRHKGLARRVAHQTGPARLHDLWQVAGHWTNSAVDALQAILNIDAASAAALIDEAQPVTETIATQHPTIAYPDYFAVEADSAMLLYAIVRAHQPNVMVETGVANGFSTAVILAAMHANGKGELHSFDIADDVGAFVRDRDHWTLHIREPLPAIPIDVFFHDSDHSYAHQTAEYVHAWEHLRPGGLLLSDDIDGSCAFIDFARNHHATMLLGGPTVFGALRR